jgi:hypothetical protein
LLATNVYARYETVDDANLAYDFYNSDIKINEDGTYEQTTEVQITLLRESARNLATKFPIPYNSDNTSVDIIEAKTIFKGKEYPVDKNMIEDKSIGNNRPGFDEYKQIAISFPYSEVGAKIYVKYKEQIKIPTLDNVFFDNYYFGAAEYWKQANFTIDSAIDLQIKTNDPSSKLSVTTEPLQDKPNYFRKGTIKLQSPIYTATTNEVGDSSLSPNLYTYVSISSVDSWKNLGNALAIEYTEILAQPTPKLFKKIARAASAEKNIVDQLNIITSKLNEEVKYFGNWRSRKGRLIPQNLATVAEKKSGDCKDFATVTVKILQELGHQANVALVHRGEGDQDVENTLPCFVFNHAIVRLIAKDGTVFWIDPTNISSMADGIFPDIAGKHALVLDKEQSSYETIPEPLENRAKLLITEVIKQDKTVNLSGNFDGEYAARLTGLELHASKKRIEDFLYSSFVQSNIEEKNKISSTIPDLTDRIVKPTTISLEYKNPDIFFGSNLGFGYNLDPKLAFLNDIRNIDTSANINDLYIGFPRTIEKTTTIEKAKAQNLENLNFTIDTPFMTLSRSCIITGENVEITTKAVIHCPWIKNAEFKSESFKKLQKIIKNDILNNAIILN